MTQDNDKPAPAMTRTNATHPMDAMGDYSHERGGSDEAVDVLAAIELQEYRLRSARLSRELRECMDRELREARAAVAELIEAAELVARHTQTLCVAGRPIGQELSDALARTTRSAA